MPAGHATRGRIGDEVHEHAAKQEAQFDAHVYLWLLAKDRESDTKSGVHRENGQISVSESVEHPVRKDQTGKQKDIGVFVALSLSQLE